MSGTSDNGEQSAAELRALLSGQKEALQAATTGAPLKTALGFSFVLPLTR